MMPANENAQNGKGQQLICLKNVSTSLPLSAIATHFQPCIYRFTVAKICVQHSFFTTITTNGGGAQVRGNFANRRAVF